MNNSPQLENGYVRIASELLEALARFNLTGIEWRIVAAIMRKTYGYNKKESRISYSLISEITNINRRSVIRSIKNLINRKVITSVKDDTDYINHYQINKSYVEWIKGISRLYRNSVIGDTSNQTSVTQVTTLVSRVTPPSVTGDTNTSVIGDTHYIQKTNNKRQSTKDRGTSLSDLTDDDFVEIAEKYHTTLAFVRSKFDDLQNYCGAHNRKYANYRLALMKWVKKDVITNFQKKNERITFIDPA